MAAWGFRSRKSVEVGFLDILPSIPRLEMPRASLVAILAISCYPMIFPLSRLFFSSGAFLALCLLLWCLNYIPVREYSFIK